MSGSVLGLVTEYDLLAREGQTAGEVMTGSVITVTEGTDVDDVRHLLVERRIRRVPVVPRQQLAGLAAEASRKVSAVMCAETLRWRCHRRLIADAAALLCEAAVWHLGHDGRLTPHRLTDGMRRGGADRMVYDNG